jgi:hypothetical protein
LSGCREIIVARNILRDFIREEILRESPAGPVMYTGVVLSPGNVRGDEDDLAGITTVAFLRSKIRELGFSSQIPGWKTTLISDIHGHEVLNHHMTITPGALRKGHPLLDRLGEPVELTVTGWGVDPDLGAAAWQVEISDPDLLPRSGNPHITAALADSDVRPGVARSIENWTPLDKTFKVLGVIREIHAVVKS